jgi:bifunctional UDP-N-acetylglucosamine pyrophosphorylase/glucosamine-1-phosphate N-acetyltransferase
MATTETATAIILAAGMGTRMRSRHPKAWHRLAGKPMLQHLIDSCSGVFDRQVVVVGPGMAVLENLAAPHPSVVQQDRLGTGHAALQAVDAFGDGDVAVLYADNPLIQPETLRRLRVARAQADLVLLAMRVETPNRYGRVLRDGGQVKRIVEFADASEQERGETLCNAGVICAKADDLRRWLGLLKNDNKAGEYYLTDVVAIANAENASVVAVEASEEELRGINSRAELAQAEAVLQQRLRRAALDGGATLTAPETVFLCADTVLQPDSVIGPHVVFGPGVVVESGAEIRAFSHLESCVVHEDAVIGPYARLRPGTTVERGAHVGNFVELKATRLGAGAKANHLTYLGDADIGEGTNLGAGTITANYDGKNKFRTVIGKRVFIGSNSTLIAPVEIGDDSLVTGGSTITNSVEADTIAFGRARQVNKIGLASQFRARRDRSK